MASGARDSLAFRRVFFHGKGLADALRRAAPALRQLGVHVEIDAKPKRDGVHCELGQGAGYVHLDGANNTPASSRSSPASRAGDYEEIKL